VSDTDHLLGLIDDLRRLMADTPAMTIEVEADGFAVTVTRRAAAAQALAPRERALAASEPDASTPKVQRVHATTVGVFSSAREWNPGDTVTRGEKLGGIQTLGHVSDIAAPADGLIREVLVSGGVPVEYGQPLFVIAIE
jgi:acetyl-CoA carboxylase biotin carboxyl carrier protein